MKRFLIKVTNIQLIFFSKTRTQNKQERKTMRRLDMKLARHQGQRREHDTNSMSAAMRYVQVFRDIAPASEPEPRRRQPGGTVQDGSQSTGGQPGLAAAADICMHRAGRALGALATRRRAESSATALTLRSKINCVVHRHHCLASRAPPR